MFLTSRGTMEGDRMRELTIAVAQAVSVTGCTDRNMDCLRRLAYTCKAQGSQLLCLPEAFLTGYNRHRASDIALDANDPRLASAEALARETGVALSFGYFERNPQNERPFVAHVVTDGTHRLVYRKTHLGPHEQDFFTPGNRLPTETIAGVCIGVHLCWEAHFPQIAATLRQRGAELLIAPFASGLGGSRRRDAWMRVLPARANDNGCYLAACNALRPTDGETAETAIGQTSASSPARSMSDGSNAMHSGSRAIDRKAETAETACTNMTGGGAIVYDPKGAVIGERFSSEEDLVVVTLHGPLPRETSDERMGNLSYFDHRRPELYE